MIDRGNIHNDLLEKAIQIATKAHTGQILINGDPYILHPLHLMSKMEYEDDRIVAVLHDVLEDSNVTLLDLKHEGFSYYHLDALEALNHLHGEPYLKVYIERVATNLLATNTKIEDLIHNMDVTRLVESPGDKTHYRRDKLFDKYLPAYNRLLQAREDFKF